MATRKILEIDEEKCTGCGECIISCEEGALEIIDGKAKLVKDIYCDGLGACLGECPEGALKIVEREADDFNEEEAMERVRRMKEEETKKKTDESRACGCPGSKAMSIEKKDAAPAAAPGADVASTLGHWPIKLQLLGPGAPFLEGADLLLLADCAGTSYPNLHRDLLPNKAVAMGCPKLDNLDAHIERLAEIVKHSALKSISVIRMEVPCCGGFTHVAEKAVEKAGTKTPINEITISRTGEIIAEEKIA